jgi:hypothetical protein
MIRRCLVRPKTIRADATKGWVLGPAPRAGWADDERQALLSGAQVVVSPNGRYHCPFLMPAQYQQCF